MDLICYLVAINSIFSINDTPSTAIFNYNLSISFQTKILIADCFCIVILLFIFADLSHNKLARIPTNAFSHLSNLTALDISYNKIHFIMPGTVYPWRNLHMLNISGNSQLDLFNLQLTFYVSLNFVQVSILFSIQVGKIATGKEVKAEEFIPNETFMIREFRDSFNVGNSLNFIHLAVAVAFCTVLCEKPNFI